MNCDIQLFADSVQTTGAAGLSAEMKTFYDMALIDEAQANLVHDQFGQKRPIPANGGKIIEFRKFAPLAKATTPLTEGVTPDGKQLSVSTVSAAVSQYGDYITQSDMLELTALDNTILESAKLLGRQAGATLDTVVRNVMHSGTNVMYAEKSTASGAEEVKKREALDRNCKITVELIQRAVAKLRALIIKTADGLNGGMEKSASELRSYADGRIEALGERYLARSEFGTFTENIESQISNTARGVVESYGYDARIESNQSGIALLQSYVTDIDGEIRRGLVTDPDTGETVTGIAISQSLQFTGEVTQGDDGMRYYELSSGQTFGLYTSTGWQFWIDGHKRGWYNSVDGMLHIANVAVEDTLQLGGGWRLVNDGGLGIKYTGG